MNHNTITYYQLQVDVNYRQLWDENVIKLEVGTNEVTPSYPIRIRDAV